MGEVGEAGVGAKREQGPHLIYSESEKEREDKRLHGMLARQLACQARARQRGCEKIRNVHIRQGSDLGIAYHVAVAL